MKNVKLIALDMDGVVNSDIKIRKWFDNKMLELENQGYSYLNNELRLEARKAFNKEFDHSTELIFPELAKFIKQIIDETDCYILWSSSWRNHPKYVDIEVAKDMLNRHNMRGDRLIGYTPTLHFLDQGIRGNQIRTWLYNNSYFDYNDLYKCAVIDDRHDAGEMLPDKCKFFWIDPRQGITEYETNKIINYLNN